MDRGHPSWERHPVRGVLVFLVVGGVAHVCRHFGADSAAAATAEATATAAVYALSGTSQFVDVSYEMAVGNISIHVLTTLAVVGTVVLGCALEGRCSWCCSRRRISSRLGSRGTQGEI